MRADALLRPLARLGAFGLFCRDLVRATLTNPPPVRRTLEEAYRIGVQSLPILLIVSVFVGTNLAVQGSNAFDQLGGQAMVGTFVALAGVREMAPIMVASMVAAKAGTEMASQIAVMRIQEQIDALEVMAIDPHWFLVTPRLFGILLVLPGLTMISVATLLTSAWVVSVAQLGLNGSEFVAQCAEVTRLADLGYGVLKAFAFAVFICLVSCFYGYTSPGGAKGVGEATNAAVVVSAVACAVLNYVLSELLYG
jgi:phospholipid/cholesterol/gamma-HCH transport system permease protein